MNYKRAMFFAVIALLSMILLLLYVTGYKKLQKLQFSSINV